MHIYYTRENHAHKKFGSEKSYRYHFRQGFFYSFYINLYFIYISLFHLYISHEIFAWDKIHISCLFYHLLRWDAEKWIPRQTRDEPSLNILSPNKTIAILSVWESSFDGQEDITIRMSHEKKNIAR